MKILTMKNWQEKVNEIKNIKLKNMRVFENISGNLVCQTCL